MSVDGDGNGSGSSHGSNSYDLLDEMSTDKPHPVQILLVNDDHTFTLDEAALESVLLSPEVANRKVAVLSVAGAFRQGKSFLLDFMLRYLQADGSDRWLGDENAPLTGFHWRGGAERDTTGILLWSKPFLRRLPSGEQIAVLLLDTQGAFDSHSTVKDCATVFALSTMVSSVQVYNLTSNIQEDDLQHLQLFTEYGRLAAESDQLIGKVFQKLIFLVRDWVHPYECPYGVDGGLELLKRRLTISPNQHPELQQLRDHIEQCFDEIECVLMPHPGLKVATNPNFDGRLAEIESDFVHELGEFVPTCLGSSQLKIKMVNGSAVTCRDLLGYFKSYIRVFAADTLPEPKSILEATADANNLQALNIAREQYLTDMEMVCGGDQPYLRPNLLERHHDDSRAAAIGRFRAMPKMGGDHFSSSYMDQLEAHLDSTYESLVKQNEAKNFLSALRTPAILFALLALTYVASRLLDLFGLVLLSTIGSVIMLGQFVTIFTWGYFRFSGNHAEIAKEIDGFTDLVWESAMLPVWRQIYAGDGYPPQYRHFVTAAAAAATTGSSQSVKKRN